MKERKALPVVEYRMYHTKKQNLKTDRPKASGKGYQREDRRISRETYKNFPINYINLNLKNLTYKRK